MKITLLKSYVDDIRKACSMLKMGTRFDTTTKMFTWSKEWEQQDHKKKEQGESKDARMARICQPAMDSVNPDLKFTTEIEEDFPDKKLPTLDFKAWLLNNGHILHTYFEKPMKNQVLLMIRSAMATKQKYTILANELTRRLSNCNREGTDQGEKDRICEEYIRQLKNSGFGRAEVREMVVSGVKGWLRRHKRRVQEGIEFYRSAANSLQSRAKKKLLGKSNWYKEKRKADEIDEKDDSPSKTRKGNKGERIEKKEQHGEIVWNSVMFVPYTWDGELVRRLRAVETKMGPLTGWRIKFIERAGVKLVDMLHKADPWAGEDCQRSKCTLCYTKMVTGKNLEQSCSRRSVIYETHCETCFKREVESIQKENLEEQEKKKRIEQIKKYVYIGESSRSGYERLWEHQRALEQLSPESHMLKHIVAAHSEEEIEDIEFHARIVKYTRTSIERQIRESTLIQESRENNHVLNSKAEYNRCSIPRLTTKLGEKETKDWLKKHEKTAWEEKEQEAELRKKIFEIRKERNQKQRSSRS